MRHRPLLSSAPQGREILRAPSGARVGILGGSFDPAHCGHVAISKAALKLFGLDQVWWMVSPGNPLKANPPAPLSARLEWARQIVDHPAILISALEAKLGSERTVDLTDYLTTRFPNLRFTWLMGADNMVQFNQWAGWRRIASTVGIGVLARPGMRQAALASKAARVLRHAQIPEGRAIRLGSADAPAWAMVNMPLHPQSSSKIRASLPVDWTQVDRQELMRHAC